MVKMKKKRTKWFHRQKLKCLSTDSKCPNFESRLRLRASISNKRRQDFFSLIDQIIPVAFFRLHFLVIWLDQICFFLFSFLHLIEYLWYVFFDQIIFVFLFSLSLNVIKLSLLFLPPIHKLGARESLRVSDAGSRGTEAANFETFHVFNFLMTKELGMENSYKETCYLVIWRLRMLDLFFRLPSQIVGMHVWGLTSSTFDLE